MKTRAGDITERIRYLSSKGKNLTMIDTASGYQGPCGVAECYERSVVSKEVHCRVSLVWNGQCLGNCTIASHLELQLRARRRL